MVQSFSGVSAFVRNVFHLFEPHRAEFSNPFPIEAPESMFIQRLYRNLKLLQTQIGLEKQQTSVVSRTQLNSV